MLNKALSVAALIGAAAAQASSDTGHVRGEDRVIQVDGETYDITNPDNRDNWKREEIADGHYTEDDELTKMIWSDQVGVEPIGDGKSRPLCNIAGFENQVDPQGPSDQCCRIYEYSLYSGRFRDFCIQTDLTDDIFNNWDANREKLFRTIQLDDYGWQNEMNSWKCGSMVWMEACQYPEDDKSKMNQVDVVDGNTESDVRKVHCDSGILQNRAMLTKSDTIDQISIGVICSGPKCRKGPGCDPPGSCTPPCLATIFSGSECSGTSKLIRSDILYRPDIKVAGKLPTKEEVWQGSWLHYDEDKWPLLQTGMVESILYDGGCAIEVFNQGKFISESFTMRMPPSENYHCTEYLTMAALNGYDWADGSNTEGYSGYKAINIREIYFPEGWKRGS